MLKQDRRSLNLPVDVYEQLSFLQAEIRLVMKKENKKRILSKTAMTNVLKALISNSEPAKIAKLLD
jgi:hypothetical protein